MKNYALGIVLAALAFGGVPASATDFKEGNRIDGYYSAAERDQVNEGVVILSKSDIKNVQKALVKAGYKPGRIDGVYGWQTKKAVKQFQLDRHLIADGKPTPRTLGALRVATRVDFDHKLDRNYN